MLGNGVRMKIERKKKKLEEREIEKRKRKETERKWIDSKRERKK